MKYYKLLSQDMTSYGDTQWEIGIPISISKEGNRMCSNEVLHCYNHPALALILNSIHADIENPRLFEIEVDKIVNSDGLKFASKRQTLVQEIPLPKLSLEQRVAFAIKVTKLVYRDEAWNRWADQWLSGENRSSSRAFAAADDAADAAADAAAAATRTAHATAAYAAAAAARAARAAAAYAAAADTTRAAADTTRAAAYTADTAYAAAYTADAAAAYAADAADAAAYAAAKTADAAADYINAEDFNKKLIDIIEEII